MAVLKRRSADVKKEESGKHWLHSIVQKLKNALQDKNMSAQLAGDVPPALTPNAAIVTFNGGPHLTQQRIEDAAPELLTTYGVKILNVAPEVGTLSLTIERPDRQILYTSQVFADYLDSEEFDRDSEKVAIGVREKDGKLQLLNPFADPHSLVSGATGSGKSVLIQSMLLYIALTRSPDKTQIYLVDGKHGVDYGPLQDLPHLKAGSGGIIVDKERSKEVLEKLVAEMEHRYKLFKETGSKDIKAYRKKTGKNLPTIFYIQDEFAEWMMDTDYAKAITQSVSSLGIKSRAAGIFMTFGLQRPDNKVMPMQLRSQLGNKLTLKVADKGTAEIAMGGEKNSGAEKLLGKGHMLAKLEGHTIPIQVPYTDEVHDLEPLVKALVKKYSYDLPG